MSTTKPKHIQKFEIEPDEIWLLLDSQTFGGIETHVLELAKGLKAHQQKARIILLTRYFPAPPIIERLEQTGLHFSFLQDLATTQGSSVIQLSHAIETYQPRLLHCHGYKSSIIGKVTKLIYPRLSLYQVSTYHAGETPKGRVWLYDALDRYTSFLSSHSLVVSNKIKEKIPSATTMLNNFVSMPERQPSSDFTSSSYRFGFVGRLSHEKAADRFLDLAIHFPDHQFHLFGDGPEREQLESRKADNCIFHGHQQNMDKVWRSIDVLIIPSRYEGLPMAALEAMSLGIPVIATAVGNLPQLINHSENGYLAHVPEDLEACVNRWLSLSQNEKTALSQQAIDTINKTYSPQAVIPQLLECYGL
ncbi:glycosyltransferase family 4 protein [Vibrio pelagius]|uniref:Glycosyltransferase family 4 protein n=1 Tax=Vibrio pelagius TaxID=28169 RepID=A0ABY5G3V0_VIBPE|nr:glycosyltransferase family 4 protein [Vibrio pelagius]UTT84829.1 glycosyltransferase family 4 protein [Vibrio pelagius]